MKDLLIIFVVLLILLIIISTLGGSVRHLAPMPYVYPSNPYASMTDTKSVEKYSEKRNADKRNDGSADTASGNSDMEAFVGDDEEDGKKGGADEEDEDDVKAPVEDEEDAEEADVDVDGGKQDDSGGVKNAQGKETSNVEGFEEGTYAPF